MTGVIGYVSTAVVYALIDMALERSLFFAPRTLGADLFGGALASAHPVVVALAYDGIRLVAVLTVGLAMAFAIRRTDRRPRLALLTLVGGIAILGVSEGVLVLVARPVSVAHWWWVVVSANLIGGLSMGASVVYRFLLRQLHEMAKRIS